MMKLTFSFIMAIVKLRTKEKKNEKNVSLKQIDQRTLTGYVQEAPPIQTDTLTQCRN